MNKRTIVLSLFWLAGMSTLRAQYTIPGHLLHLSLEQGLSQSSVTDFCQDAKGNMWIATLDGLNKYNGYNFTVFRAHSDTQHSIKSSRIVKLFLAPNNLLFVYTSQGLSVMDLYTETVVDSHIFEAYDFSAPLSLDDSTVLFFQKGKGLYTFDLHTLRTQSVYPYMSQRVRHMDVHRILLYKKKLICLTGQKKILICDLETDEVHDFSFESYVQKSICHNDTLYIGTRSTGLAMIALPSYSLHLADGGHAKYNINSLEHIDEHLFCFSYGQGIFQWNPARDKLESNRQLEGMSDYFLNTYKDKFQNVWMGTDGDGILIYDRANTKFRNLTSNNIGSVRSIAEDEEGNIYIATFSKGLLKYNPKGQSLTNVNIPTGINPNALLIDGNKIWLGTDAHGLYVLDKNNHQVIKQFSAIEPELIRSKYSRIYFIKKLNNGNILVSTQHEGAVVIDPRNFRIVHKLNSLKKSLSSDAVRTSLQLSDGSVALGMEGHGISVIDLSGAGPIRNVVEVSDRVSKFGVKCLWEDTHRNLWIGTNGEGIIVLDSALKFKSLFNTKNILSNDVVYGILPSELGPENEIWFSSNAGLSKIKYRSTPDSIQVLNIDHYNVKNGLQSNEFNSGAYQKLKSGKLAFGGIVNINIFDPSDMDTTEINLPVNIFDFKIFNKTLHTDTNISYLSTIELEPNQNSFSLLFHATGLFSPSDIEYRYRLLGFQDDWQYIGSLNSASFTNMPAGDYTFEVQSRFTTNRWPSTSTSLQVHLATPFYQTWWFYLLIILMVGGLLWLLDRLRVREIKRKSMERLEIMLSTQEEERRRISMELHDDFGARLSTLKLYLQAIKNSPQEVNQLVGSTSDIIDQSISELRNILYNLSPKSLAEEGLEATLDDIIRHINNSKIINAKTSISLDRDIKLNTAYSIYRIVMELINNTLKHAQAKNIEFSLTQRDSKLVLYYEDDGVGFDPDTVQTGYGYHTIRNHIELHSAQVYIESQPGKGTVYTIEFPLSVME